MTETDQPDDEATPEPPAAPGPDEDERPADGAGQPPSETASTDAAERVTAEDALGPDTLDAEPAGLDADGLPAEFDLALAPRFRVWHAIVAFNGLAILAVAAVLLLAPWRDDEAAEPGGRAVRRPSRQEPPGVTDAEPPVDDAFSLRLEEAAYAAGRYREALAQCDRLAAATRGNPRDELLGDFFRLRRAQCRRWLGRMPEAHEGLVEVAESPSPIVRGAALLELAHLALADRQYLTARTQAYRAVASLGAVAGTRAMQNVAEALAAQALTCKALAFYGADGDLPEADLEPPDPFAGLAGEKEVRALLAAGTRRFRDAAAGLQADRHRPTEEADARWSVTSVGAPLEAILHRVAGPSDLDVAWTTAEPPARRRAVLLALTDATETRVAEVACGAVGLVARMTGRGVEVHDPRAVRSTAALGDLTAREAVSMWRRTLLRTTDRSRHAYAHFALGLLYEHQGETASAMSEYNLLAQRYETSALAPRAMLRCAGMRIDLRDYTGAREGLLDLLNRHPNFPDSGEVYLRLGQATLRAGLLEEAVATFRKLYYWELSRASQTGAAFGAGKGYWLKGEPAEAVKWFRRYRRIAGSGADRHRPEANYLLARSLLALGQAEAARSALRRSLAADPPQPLRADATLALAAALGEAAEYPEALALLHRLQQDEAPAAKVDRAILLQARLLRTMGLADRAMRCLKKRRTEAASTAAAIEMEIELARCCAALERPDDARRLLEAAVAHLDPGPLARQASADLAEVHLAAGRTRQAVSMARALLARDIPDALRRRALRTLGRAYLAQRDYDRAAVAFAGKVPDPHEGDRM